MDVELTPELLIRELHRGATLPRVLSRYGAKQALVNRWKRDPQFQQQLDRALAERRKSAPRTVEQRIPDLHDRFIAAYEEMGDRATISGAVKKLQEEGLEVSLGTMYGRLSDKSSNFDPVLAERYEEAQALRVAPIEERYLDGLAETGDLKLQREFLERNSLTRGRHAKPPERLEVDVRRETTRRVIAEHRQTVRLEFAQEAREKFGQPTTPEVIDVSDERSNAAQIGSGATGERGDEGRRGEDGQAQADEEEGGQAQEEVA